MSVAPVDAPVAVGAEPATESEGVATRRRRLRPADLGALIGVLWLTTLGGLAVFADRLAFIRDYRQKVYVDGAVANGSNAIGPGTHAWFGTDMTGFDVFAKCIYGARLTLFVGIVAVGIGVVVGGLLGIVAGYFGGRTDRVVSLLTDVLVAFPPIIIASVLIFRVDDLKDRFSWLEALTRQWQVALVLGVLSISPQARTVRAHTMSLRQRDYVLAAHARGASHVRILTREILPNVVGAILSVALTALGIVVAAEAGLAFLGLSVEIPTPTWGRLVGLSFNRIDRMWWPTFFPCALLFMTVLSFNMIGERIAKRFDVREIVL